MRFLKTLFVTACAAACAAAASGQTIHVVGTVEDGNGTPLNGAAVFVKDGQGGVLGQATSNVKGEYLATATPSAKSVTCEVLVDPDAPKKYSSERVVEQITIASDPVKQDCVFYQATTAEAYWKAVRSALEARAERTPNASKGYAVLMEWKEWQKIEASGLSPDSKAAAAKELAILKIDDQKFKDYVSVNHDLLENAMKGDRVALANLPSSVAEDVKVSVPAAVSPKVQ